MSDTAHISNETRKRHWARTRNLTVAVVGFLLVFSLILPVFAGRLNGTAFLGFPLGYYLIAQGSLIALLVLVVIQNWRQDRIDDQLGVGEE